MQRQKRKERLTNPIRNGEDSYVRRSSLSSKMLSKLSMSFYGETTIRKHKQVILDDCAYNFGESDPKSEVLRPVKHKTVKSAPKRKKEGPQQLPIKEKDESDFRTTQDSKMECKGDVKKGVLRMPQSKTKLANKSRKNSLQKFRKLLLTEIVQSRVKTPKALLLKRESTCTKKQ